MPTFHRATHFQGTPVGGTNTHIYTQLGSINLYGPVDATLGVGLVETGRGSWSLWVLPLTWGTQVSPRSYLCFPAWVSWGP